MSAIFLNDPMPIDGWNCPHCKTWVALAEVEGHVRATHDDPCCRIELILVNEIIKYQKEHR